jgi:hypothetical protein
MFPWHCPTGMLPSLSREEHALDPRLGPGEPLGAIPLSHSFAQSSCAWESWTQQGLTLSSMGRRMGKAVGETAV